MQKKLTKTLSTCRPPKHEMALSCSLKAAIGKKVMAGSKSTCIYLDEVDYRTLNYQTSINDRKMK